MKKYNSQQLLLQLQSAVRAQIAEATRLRQEDPALLLEQPEAGKWSVIQALAHLNIYGDFYLPAISQALTANKAARTYFKSGWLGNYFVKLMQPDATGNIGKKMKATARHRPSFHVDANPVVQTFLQQQYLLLELLEQARSKDLNSLRTPISIAPFITLRLGDTFRFLVAHQERHFQQIQRTLLQVRIQIDRYPAIHQVA